MRLAMPRQDERTTGIHAGVPVAEYEAWDALRSSHLKAFRKTAAHARHAMLLPREPTEALELGQATHAAILEPGSFEAEWIAAPKLDRRTKAGKLKWAEFQEAQGTKQILKQHEYDLCLQMRDAVWEHPLAGAVLGERPGLNELSVLFEIPGAADQVPPDRPGRLGKARVDRITVHEGWTVVADVKTAIDASRPGFARAVANFDYHIQAAWYLDGLDVLEEHPRRFWFIAVEKTPPFCVAVYELEPEALDAARVEIANYLDRYWLALREDRWPGYPAEVQFLALPRWRMPELGEL